MPRYKITLKNGSVEEVQADSAEVLQDDDEPRGRRKGDLVLSGVPSTERSSGHYRKAEWETFEEIAET